MRGSVGVIGLGTMGSRMAHRLAASGFRVVGFDVSGAQGKLPAQAEEARDVADVARQAEVVLLSLPDGNASRAVAREIAAFLRSSVERSPLHTVVDLSTIGARAAIECAELLREVGIDYLDAPVSGGPIAVEEGRLTVMVAGTAEALERVRPYLAAFAGHIFHVGSHAGQGQVIKLVNNYIAATALAVTCEGVAFAVSQGLDMRTVLDVLNVSTGRTTASTDMFPRSVLPGTYDFGFRNRLLVKDLLLYVDTLMQERRWGVLPSVVTHLWEDFAREHPDADATYFYEYARVRILGA
ncbi:NAD(P)-dependent oxidoreductase [Thermomicrobium sp. 4228-Ro]|nr:NAD(P)-dependent oxidoreductase [Thermomicrobium sp. 4228-Ro]MCX2728595.1 NAD(P)-dependent oxidoreductase [Thermomicrobium sp. 4228-Ro]